jgi:predicted nucleotidyltransferase
MALTANAPVALVAAAFANIPEVDAVALAGSKVAGSADEQSDLDFYVYARAPVTMADRGAIATRFATRREVGNDFWEPGDEWIDRQSGRQIDVMYRTPVWIEEQLDRVLVRHEASVGYSTCFWHNVLHSRPLHDPHGWYLALREWADRPYPEPLQQAIIARNHPILREAMSSYTRQIERAVARGDSVSVQHRITALLASYFDILFAVNALPHPGEKALLPFALTHCAKQASGMKNDVESLLATVPFPADSQILERVHALLDRLDALLAAEGLLLS